MGELVDNKGNKGAAGAGAGVGASSVAGKGALALPGARVVTATTTLADSDFIFTARPRRRQGIFMVFGDTGVGKTYFAARYAPDPVVVIGFDHRSEDTIEKCRHPGLGLPDRRIGHVDIELGDQLKLSEASKLRARMAFDRVMYNYEIAIRESEKGNVRSICLDTGTEMTLILKLLHERLDGKDDYGASDGKINLEWLNMYTMARESQAHLIVLARAKSIWENHEPTGRFEYRGPKAMSEGVDWVGQLRFTHSSSQTVRKLGELPKFELEITKAGVNLEQLGKVYGSDEWEPYGGPFVYASMQMYGGKPQDWK